MPCATFWSGWVPQYKKDGELLQRVQRRAIRMKKDLSISYEESLWELGMVSLEKSRWRGDLIDAYKYLKNGYQQYGVRLFPVVPSTG